MTERKLQNIVSIFLIIGHYLILLMVAVLYCRKNITPEVAATCCSVIVPMLGALTTIAINYAISVKKKKAMSEASDELSGVYVFTVLFLPILFLATTAAVVLVKAGSSGLLSSPDDFRNALTGVETVFGVYTGKVLGSLFEKGIQSPISDAAK